MLYNTYLLSKCTYIDTNYRTIIRFWKQHHFHYLIKLFNSGNFPPISSLFYSPSPIVSKTQKVDMWFAQNLATETAFISKDLSFGGRSYKTQVKPWNATNLNVLNKNRHTNKIPKFLQKFICLSVGMFIQTTKTAATF